MERIRGGEEHKERLIEKMKEIGELYPSSFSSTSFSSSPSPSLSGFSSQDAFLCLLSSHLSLLSSSLSSSLSYLTLLTHGQLLSALGKEGEISLQEMYNFLHFRQRKIFSSSFSPKPLSYFIRGGGGREREEEGEREEKGRKARCAIGRMSLEEGGEPVKVFTRRVGGGEAEKMSFSLGAGVKVFHF